VAAAENSRPFLFLRTGLEGKREGARRVALLRVGQTLAEGGVIDKDWDEVGSGAGLGRVGATRASGVHTPADQVFTEEELALMEGDA
jgi:hypothetical protein